jgi:hypothetical protein
MRSAVREVEDLLSRMDMEDLGRPSSGTKSGLNKTAFVRAEASPCVVGFRERALRFGRWANPMSRTSGGIRMMLDAREGVEGDFVWMDSVKRKRKKKISKHK